MSTYTVTVDCAADILQQLFREHGVRADIEADINGVLFRGLALSTTCSHYISDELTRLSYEIPFQRMMGDSEEQQRAIDQKAAYELVLEMSAVAEQNAKSKPDKETVKIFTLKLVLSQMERDDINPCDIERISKNLEDERQELIFVECLFGTETPQYKAILNEIAEWEKLLTEAVTHE